MTQGSGFKGQTFIVNIGLDFGTASTKIMWRIADGPGRGRLTLLGSQAPGASVSAYPAACIPSSLRIAGGRVYFGRDAESRTDGEVFRSLKICLVSEGSGVPCRCMSSGHADGLVAFRDEVGSEGVVPVETLTTMLLAGLLNHAKARVRAALGTTAEITFLYNFAAPLDQVDHLELGALFDRVAWRAVQASDMVASGMSFDEARDQLERVSRVPLPDPSQRNFKVLPEAIAAIHAYTNSAGAVEGLYAVADVGAGTSTVSYFRLGRQAADKRVAFYASHTGGVGCDDIDRALLTSILGKMPHEAADRKAMLESVRLAKHGDILGAGMSLNGAAMTGPEVGKSMGPVLGQLLTVNHKAFQRAYEKQQGQAVWQRLTAIHVGGGSLVAGVADRLSQKPHAFVRTVATKALELPAAIAVDGMQALDPGDVPLLAVAYGLSFVAPEIPDYWNPRDVDPLVPIRPPEREIDEDWRY